MTPREAQAEAEFLAGDVIRLRGDTTIGGDFLTRLCRRAWAEGKSLPLRVEGGRIEGDLRLDYVRTDQTVMLKNVTLGTVRLGGARLHSLVMGRCTVAGIEAAGLETSHMVDLNDRFRATARVRLVAAVIGADLNCDEATFERSTEDADRGWAALIFDTARIAGNVRFNRVTAHGPILGRRARVDGAVTCRGRLENGTLIERAKIDGDLRLEDSVIGGSVTLRGIALMPGTPPKAQADRDADTKRLDGALVLSRTSIGGLLVEDAQVAGSIHVDRAVVNGDMSLQAIAVGGPKLDLSGTTVHGVLKARAVQGASDRGVCLRLVGVSVDSLDDCARSWPERKGNDRHHVDGLTMQSLASSDLKWRICWLRRNATFTPQPWQAVGGALRRAGREGEARILAIAREEYRTRCGGYSRFRKLGRRAFGLALGYGYKPARALSSAFVILVGCTVAFACHSPDPHADAPPASAVLYSLDAFLPIDLGYYGKFTPSSAWWSGLAAGEALLGWLVTALLLAALTGILKKD